MLRPPFPLLAGLVATTLVVTAALCWAGWRLLDQQGAIDDQRARERLEASADAIASQIAATLAEAGEGLSAWLSDPESPPRTIVGRAAVAIGPDGVRVAPGVPLPFVPAVGPAPPPIPAFDAIERIEFAARVPPARASARYRLLAASRDSDVRAGALLRLGRVLRKTGDFAGALGAYRQLADLGREARAEGLPADLAALSGQRAVFLAQGDRDGERRAAAEVSLGLDEGRWLVTRGVAEYLRDEVGGASRPDSWQLANALSDAWREMHGRSSARGLRVFREDGRPVLVLWRSGGLRTALLASFADRLLATPASVAVAWRLADPEGRVVAGTGNASGRPVARLVGGSDSPWTLHAWPPASASPASARSRQTLIAMMAATLVFVWAASYFIGRAIRREAEVSRLQSDFVAAVSHEFRSPLTAICQMAEMLETERLTTEERRRLYFRRIASEAARLRRLVETLLDFGKMEAGAARYHLVDVDAAALGRAVVGEMEAQACAAGMRLEASGPDEGIPVLADEGALALALRNLVDNAIKYSPGRDTVSIRWAIDDGATISVMDRGTGIPRAERQAIFRKFFRGAAAAERNVPGTGVGLTMAQEIVRAHGGEIRVESEVGRGSTFTVRLPLHLAATAGVAATEVRRAPASEGGGSA